MRHEDLTEPERRVWEAFPHGGRVDLRSGDPGVDDPVKGERWQSDRTIRGELIRAIVLGEQTAFAPTGAYQWLSYALITSGWILATTIITGISRALYRS